VEFKNILLNRQNRIAVLTFNRPEVLNALSSEVLNELNDAIDYVKNDDDILIVIITGTQKSFVAGADISELKNITPKQARDFSVLGSKVFRKIELLEKPVIAAVNGYALGGGCELAMSCDIIIASERAKFGQPEVNLGVIPGFSGTQRLSRLIGPAKAKELIFTGKTIDAREAEKIGLVNKVVADNSLMDEAFHIAELISSKSQTAVRYAKTSICRGFEADIETAISIENNLFALCFASPDQKEGVSAFLEKRKPNFTGK